MHLRSATAELPKLSYGRRLNNYSVHSRGTHGLTRSIPAGAGYPNCGGELGLLTLGARLFFLLLSITCTFHWHIAIKNQREYTRSSIRLSGRLHGRCNGNEYIEG